MKAEPRVLLGGVQAEGLSPVVEGKLPIVNFQSPIGGENPETFEARRP
jgi:hypothetical protein